MNSRRSFFKCLPFLGFLSVPKPSPALAPPMREFPWYTPAEVVGLWAQAWDYDKKTWGEPYLILSEYDEENDTWQGQRLYNPRRNKFWGESMVSKKRELLCFDAWDHGVRFFRNTPNTDWSLVYPQAL